MRAVLDRWERARAGERVARLLPWAPALPGLAALLLAWASYGGRLIDDAYISLTYAQNLVDGNGLVFHPVLPRTEGYSNLLWTLLLALGLGLGASGAAVATLLGLACAAATVALVARHVGGARGAATGLAIACSPVFGYWSGAGLETALATLLLVVGVLWIGRIPSWVAFGLLGISRVEGVAWGALGLLHAVLTTRRLPSARALGLWLGPLAAQLVFRELYYGSLVPAPVIAKVGEDLGRSLERGLGWLSGALRGQPLEVLILLGVAAWTARELLRRRPRPGPGPWALLAALGTVLFSLAVGGDWMPNLRWLMPAIPLLWIAFADLPVSARASVSVALLSALLGSQIGIIDQDGAARPRLWKGVSEVIRQGPRPLLIHPAHLFVLEYLDEDDVVLHPDVGALSYLTGNPVLDPQGLCWADVARVLQDGADDPRSADELARVEETIRALKPALIAVPFLRGSAPLGPVGAVLFEGSKRATPAPWFSEGWELWRTEEHNAATRLSYFLRKDLVVRPSKEQRLRRLQAALQRAPEAEALLGRVSWALLQLDRDEEARQVEAGMDHRARNIAEIWSR